MSTQYPGGFITKSPVAPTSTAASGIWTVDQALQYVKAGTWPSPPLFIEEMFSTYIYTGNSSTQTITNGLNLSGSGGLVWIKPRSGTYGVDNHILTDTVRGSNKNLYSNLDIAETTTTSRITAFNSNGFSLQSENGVNNSATNYVSWSFKEQSKFFDIVTYTGNAVAGRQIAHNLGSVPGVIIVKCRDTAGEPWYVYHRSLGATKHLTLNSVNAATTSDEPWYNTEPTSTNFTVAQYNSANGSGKTYVAYLFAHDAGGFPANGGGSTNGITCGSLTTDASGNATVNLGYEPQWILIKKYNTTGSWVVIDNMRGWNVGSADQYLLPNSADTEGSAGKGNPTATGFLWEDSASASYIYITIRRGPMKTPTVGTSVFSPIAVNAATGTAQTTNFRPDMQLLHYRDGTDGINTTAVDRLRGISTNTTGGGENLKTSSTTAEGASSPSTTLFWNNTGFQVPGMFANANSVYYTFQRAPGFFDEVCYTGTGAVATQSHNLGVAPEMMIVKKRNVAADWQVYHSALGPTKLIELNLTGSESTSSTRWNDTAPTASVFTIGTHTTVNASGATYVNYLFATLAGISKVGSFTGTAALQTIACGFTTGARWVMIKRYDAGSTGDWYVWDSARGISSSTDPYFLMNTTIGEVTGTNYVDTTSTGFQVTAAGSTTVNISAATYIFLAIA